MSHLDDIEKKICEIEVKAYNGKLESSDAYEMLSLIKAIQLITYELQAELDVRDIENGNASDNS